MTRYLDQLIDRCEKARQAPAQREYKLRDSSDIAKLSTRSPPSVYWFEDLAGDTESTFEMMQVYKATRQRACPRLNHPSSTLYVGSSKSTLKRRLAEHLGLGSKHTYALHLNHWFNGPVAITVREYDVESGILQLIEDDLAYALSPAFGKKGGNNR